MVGAQRQATSRADAQIRGEDQGGVSAAEVWEIEPVLRRVVASRVHDRSAVDDLVQDALEHLLAARGRLQREMVVPYGVVTARNLAVSHGRSASRRAALTPKLVGRDSPEQPDEVLLRAEEQAAVAMALARLPESDRLSLLAHEVHGAPVASLAEEGQPVATARVRLARSRAKLRVEYILALRRVELPSAECRSTLFVLAGGDKARQRSSATGRHLLGCDTCASLSEPLLSRRRGLAVLLPLVVVHWIAKAAKSHPVTSSAVAAGAAVAAAGGVALAAGGAPVSHMPAPSKPASIRFAPSGPAPAAPASQGAAGSGAPVGPGPSSRVTSLPPTLPPQSVPGPAATPTGALTIDGRSPFATGPALSAAVGHLVVAQAVSVESVATHNGFWVGASPAQRVWVQLTGPLRPIRVFVGEHVSFVAPLVGLDAVSRSLLGVDAAHGSAMLWAQGAYVAVPTTAITVTP